MTDQFLGERVRSPNAVDTMEVKERAKYRSRMFQSFGLHNPHRVNSDIPEVITSILRREAMTTVDDESIATSSSWIDRKRCGKQVYPSAAPPTAACVLDTRRAITEAMDKMLC